jgi:chromosome segregation ATPase
MANGLKTYTIRINGLQESVNAVDSLNKQLDNLEQRIDALNKKGISIKQTGGGKSDLANEDKLEKEILATEEKLAQVRDENYKKLLHMKEELKEYTQIAKSQVAAEANQQGLFDTSTMAGMKAQLKSIKAEMQTVDIGGDRFKELTQQANDLNNKLKEIEQSYGQFGRNVGNYANGVAEGMQKIKITVNGVDREFTNAREASRTLNNELKSMAVNGQRGTKEYKNLQKALAEFNSTCKDATVSSEAMNNVLHTMQSFVATAQVTQGLGGLFGLDDAEMQRSIQRMVSLQNVMMGIERINQQINERVGLGKWFASLYTGIDKAIAGMLKFNTVLLGTSKAAKIAATGIKVFGSAVKVAISGGLLLAIDAAINAFSHLIDKMKNGTDAMKAVKKATEDGVAAYARAKAEITVLMQRLEAFNGTKKEEKHLVDELNSDYKDSIGMYKSVDEWKTELTRKAEAYCQVLKNEAEAQAYVNRMTELYIQLHDLQAKQQKWYWNLLGYVANGSVGLQGKVDEVQGEINSITDKLTELSKANAELMKNNKIGDYAPQIEKNGKKTKKAIKDVQDDINKAQLDAMKDGLRKTLMQLDEEERQLINKVKENGKNVAENLKKVEEIYTQKRLKALQDYIDKLGDEIDEMTKKLNETQFDIDVRGLEADVEKIGKAIEKLNRTQVPNLTLTSQAEYSMLTSGITSENIKAAYDYVIAKEMKYAKDGLDEYHKWLDKYLDSLGEDVKEKFEYINPASGEKRINYDEVEAHLERHYRRELEIVDGYGYKMDKSLKASILERWSNYRSYYNDIIIEIANSIEKQRALEVEAEAKESTRLQHALDDRYKTEKKALDERKKELEDALTAMTDLAAKKGKELTEKEKEKHENIKKALETTNYQLETLEKQYYDEYDTIMKESFNKNKEINDKYNQERIQNAEKYYDNQLTNYRDYLSKINELEQKQPVYDKAGWGIVNVKRTKAQYKEILDAANVTFDLIQQDRQTLSDDFKKGLIEPADYDAILRQLNDLEAEAKETAFYIEKDLNNTVGMFIQSINQYVQVGLQAVQTVMQAINEYQDYQLDKQADFLDKENEMIEKKLSEQEDIISRYKEAVDDIEDELSSARGDRRQHLIDQLNAEVSAQRAAMAEEKKLQKQKEANEKKQEELDKKRKQAEYKRNLLQILVSTAMATANGLATQPFVPVGIAMGALATTLGMVQYALAQKAKPYAKGGQLDGGVAVGPRHRDGGIKVLGGRSEIEGGEFITNRVSTQYNAPLLEFINSRKKRVDISDLIDFYSSGKVKKNINSIKTKFEDGGYIPLPSNLDIKDQLQNIVVNQDNRPIYVTVTDIENKMEDVRYVRTLAGL